jgi:Flp pilus assembly protein TadD
MKRHQPLIVGLSLVVITMAVFWQVHGFDFLIYDDDDYITQNEYVNSGWSPEGLIWAFTTTIHGHYHPLTWLSHMTDAQLFGLDPAPHHLINLLFHLSNVLLLFYLLKRMTGDLWKSAFVAAVFAVHPLNVESVAWVTERKNVLSTLFWFLTMGAYLRYVERPSILRYSITFVAFLLGLLSKVMLITLPLVLLLIDFWPLGRFQGDLENPKGHRGGRVFPLVLEKLPFFAPAVLAVVIVLFYSDRAWEVKLQDWMPDTTNVSTALLAYVTYLWRFFFPVHLTVTYPLKLPLPLWQSVCSGLVLVCVTWVLTTKAKGCPYLSVGWLWYLITLLPVIGLIGKLLMADRYMYIPMIGILMMIAWGMPQLISRWRFQRIVGPAAGISFLAACLFLAAGQTRYWRDSIALFSRTLDLYPDHNLALNSIGVVLAKEGRFDEAIVYFKEALKIKPDHAEARMNLAHALVKQGRMQEALIAYREALRFTPNNADIHHALGMALAWQGKYEEAVIHLKKALNRYPNSAAIHMEMGGILTRLGRFGKAESHLKAALKLEPASAKAHYHLGDVLLKQGRLEEARPQLQRAVQMEPTFGEAHHALGLLLAREGRLDEAVIHFEKAVEIAPNDARAISSLGLALAQMGRSDEAIARYKEALGINPHDQWSRFSLGMAYLMKGDTRNAHKVYRSLRKIHPSLAKKLGDNINSARKMKSQDARRDPGGKE